MTFCSVKKLGGRKRTTGRDQLEKPEGKKKKKEVKRSRTVRGEYRRAER